jgi:uncharacterized membrane protein
VHWRQIGKLWVVLALIAAWPALFYMVRHGLCDAGTCGPNWLRPLVEIFVGVGVVNSILIWATRDRNDGDADPDR